jgi:hypothetical protein
MFDSFQPIKGCSDGLIGCSNTSDKQSDCGQHLKRSPQRNFYCLIDLLISQNRFQSGQRTQCDNEKRGVLVKTTTIIATLAAVAADPNQIRATTKHIVNVGL